MVDQRAAILAGTKAAHSLHRDLGARERIERQNGARVDVFGAITKLGATLMFSRSTSFSAPTFPPRNPGS